MLFSYNWLQTFFDRKLPNPEKLAEILTLQFAEVEEVKKQGKDFVLDIDVRPNRAHDCFSHIGIAREISAILGIKCKASDVKIQEDKKLKSGDLIKVEVKHSWACPRYIARAMTGVRVGSSPKWLQERLLSCGLRPINSIVDATNYVMLETGQPLHAFDAEKISGKKIIVRFAKDKEKIVTLDNQKFELNSEVLVISDAENSLAIAGIKGGKKAEIDEKTKTVILEAANFAPQVIRQGARFLNLRTDASLRFEHGLDPNLPEQAINKAAGLIKEISDGNILKGPIDVYPKKALPKRIKLDLSYVARLLGIEIPKKEIKRILISLGFKMTEAGSAQAWVEAPTNRLDVSLQEDLIEEIGRIYGYQKISPDFPQVSLIPPKTNLDIFWQDMAKGILKNAGFIEVYNYSFLGENDINAFGYSKKELVELENPLSQDYKYLRPSLIPGLLKNIEKNSRNSQGIKIFETGGIFLFPKVEKKMMSGAITGDSFYLLKGTIDELLQKLGISGGFYDEYKPTPEESKLSIWKAGRAAEIKIEGKEIGFLGEISAPIRGKMGIKGKVVLFDINFEKLSQFVSEEHEYRPISRFPEAVRDVAVLTPREIKVEEVLNVIELSGGETVRDVDLFDIYEGENLPQGKKNLAFHIIYQAKDRTLSSREIDEIQSKIIKALEGNPEWQVRR